LNAFQLTIEWARVVPKMPASLDAPLGRDDVDADAVAHYHAVLHSLTSRGITPIVTVTHFSLPRWVHDPAALDPQKGFSSSLGGFAGDRTPAAIAQYARFLATEFGDEVNVWLTIDEPMVALVAGYMGGQFPPGLNELSLSDPVFTNGPTAIGIMRNMAASHALAYHAIKSVRPDARVSFAHNSVVWDAIDDTPEQVAARDRVDHAYNLAFLDALALGDFDTGLVGTGPIEHHDEWAHTLDFIGVNYYDRAWVLSKPALLPPLEAMPCSPSIPSNIRALFGCPTTPLDEIDGARRILLEYQARYGLPQLVTENGFIDTPAGKARSLVGTLAAIHDAITQGANVIGYSYWTLNYDYEWNDGYTQNMGLFSIAGFPTEGGGDGFVPSRATDFTRVALQPIDDVFAEIAQTNRVSSALRVRYR
jgi:beta-glucosidase/6-phospho-beta-glucosidase/beta-galactosidase